MVVIWSPVKLKIGLQRPKIGLWDKTQNRLIVHDRPNVVMRQATFEEYQQACEQYVGQRDQLADDSGYYYEVSMD